MIGIQEILQARERIGTQIYRTPCARSEHFSEVSCAATYFKLENLQITGSFKERGALNKILSLSDEQRERGLITASAGNHAQAVAFHAGKQGLRATIVMPKRTPLIKVSNTRSFGADVILEGDDFDEAYAHARELEQQTGKVFIHPFDDDFIIAGQGTIGLELMEQVPELEVVIVPIGGGGVISGIALAFKALRPHVQIIGVETAVLPSMKESREAGQRLSLPPAFTIADGIAVKRPGERTLEIVREHVDDIVTVDEEEIANAILLLLEREKTVAEGAAAATLAALYNRHVPQADGRHTAMVLCGGNIDVNLLSRIIERGLIKDGRQVQLDILIRDRPGALAALLDGVARAEANVLEVFHQRTSERTALGDVEVKLRLETRGRDHVRSMVAALRSDGFKVSEV